MAVCPTAALTLVLLLLSPAECSAPPSALQNKQMPDAVGDLGKANVHEDKACEIISLTEEPPATPLPTKPPVTPQSQPVLPPLPVIPLVPNSRYPVLLPSRGAVVPVQGVGGWVVPGLYPPLQVLFYPPGNPQYPALGQVPLIYGRNPLSSVNPGFPANVNPLNPLYPPGWGTVHRKWVGPHALGGLGKRKSSEEHDD